MILFDYALATHLMGQSGIDLLLPNSIVNAGYLADYWRHDKYGSISPFSVSMYALESYNDFGELFVGLARDSSIDPFITCRRTSEESEILLADVWIQDRRVHGPNVQPRSIESPLGPAFVPYADVFDATAEAVRERHLERTVIGVEMPCLSVREFEELRRRLPDAHFVDAFPLFSQLRLVKCAEELRRLRVASRANQDALAAVVQATHAGTTGLEMVQRLETEHLRAGVRHEQAGTQIGPSGMEVHHPTSRTARLGEVIRLDSIATYWNYFTDAVAEMVVGEPRSDVVKIHRAVKSAVDAVLDEVRPGVPVSRLFERGSSVLEQEMRGLGVESFAGVLGHGIGRDVHEGFAIAPDDPTVLKAGMALAVEITVARPDLGVVGVEDDILVSIDGHEDLTTISRELHVVPA